MNAKLMHRNLVHRTWWKHLGFKYRMKFSACIATLHSVGLWQGKGFE